MGTLDTIPLSQASIAYFAFSAGILYLLGLSVYRLYLSPLAKFPGPKLAALTRWYEFYYECLLLGQFPWRIRDMHAKYGPIVRIGPNELHIKDSDFHDDFYSKNTKVYKDKDFANMFGASTAVFVTPHPTDHRRRRAALNPMFSKRAIMEFSGEVSNKVQLMFDKMAEYQKSGKPLAVNLPFSALAGDIMCEYCFGVCYEHLESPGFEFSFHPAFDKLLVMGHWTRQFPWIHPVLNAIPPNWTKAMDPEMMAILDLQRDLRDECGRMIEAGPDAVKVSHPTIFSEVLKSDLDPSEKTKLRMSHEAQIVIGAGIETTAWTLSCATYYILSDAQVLHRLRQELNEGLKGSPSVVPDVADLEKLPYLRACISESLRLSYGVSGRNPRLLDKPVKYKDWVIPPFTKIGLSTPDVHHDEEIFPDSYKFKPERWLGNPRAPNGQSLERYLVSFGKGSRSCLGINLAWAEMFMVVATLFRRFELELFETDYSDIEYIHDFFSPSPKRDSKGVRVKVTKVYS